MKQKKIIIIIIVCIIILGLLGISAKMYIKRRLEESICLIEKPSSYMCLEQTLDMSMDFDLDGIRISDSHQIFEIKGNTVNVIGGMHKRKSGGKE